MAKFMDVHTDLKMPEEAINQIKADTVAGKIDKFGVRQLELYHNDQGQVYCLLDAPDAEAVRQHHAALGVGCNEVHPVRSLM